MEEGESKHQSAPKKSGVVGSRNLNMTDQHRAGLQQLKDRDVLIVSDNIRFLAYQ
jgi:hypothetical protein